MRKNRQKGSLLIEALLSVVILSVSLTIIIQSLTGSLRAVRYSTRYTQALFLAENEMEGILLKESIDPPFYDEGKIEGLENAYYSIAKAKVLSKINQGNITDVSVELSWSRKVGHSAVTLGTYFLKDNGYEDANK